MNANIEKLSETVEKTAKAATEAFSHVKMSPASPGEVTDEMYRLVCESRRAEFDLFFAVIENGEPTEVKYAGGRDYVWTPDDAREMFVSLEMSSRIEDDAWGR